MKIINLENAFVYYNTEGDEEILVSPAFWNLLQAGKVKYADGGKEGEIFITRYKILDLESKDFEKEFLKIANSGLGKFVMTGKRPADTIL